MTLGALWLTGCGVLGASEEQREWPEPSPALWEVNSPEGQKGWLFGTIHALSDGVEWRTPALAETQAQSDLLIVEIDNLEPGASSYDFNAMARDEPVPPLEDRLEPGELQLVSRLQESANLDATPFDEYETWAIAIMLANATREGDPANGVDRALLAEPGPTVALETAPSQLAMFDDLPETEQADLLVAVAAETGETPNFAAIEAWLTGDLEALSRLAEVGILGDPELREALNSRRNRDWVYVIESAFAEGHSPLIAVGAAHMLGSDGLPSLLTAQGYTVTRIQ